MKKLLVSCIAIGIFFDVSIVFGFLGARVAKSKKDPITCPSNYIYVQKLAGYTTQDFCVAKFEAKQEGSQAVSRHTHQPWVSILRASARTACQVNGAQYDIPTNAQWQTIARSIADVPSNWSTGVAYEGQLNIGHTDNSPASRIAASSDDDQGCINTSNTCSGSVWHAQRRTHRLKEGGVIWDFSGNIWEWVVDDNNSAQGANGYISTFDTGDSRQLLFGHTKFCESPGATPYCGYGNGDMNYSAGTIIRGGALNRLAESGVFATSLQNATGFTSVNVGFRCVYNP